MTLKELYEDYVRVVKPSIEFQHKIMACIEQPIGDFGEAFADMKFVKGELFIQNALQVL